MKLKLINEDGATLDEMTLSAGGVSYTTGRAQPMVIARAGREQCTEMYACAALEGWSNGYRRIVRG